MKKRVLITGGTGLIGSLLAEKLWKDGYQIHILSRTKKAHDRYSIFKWDINAGYIEEGALDVDVIFHLAGAGIADKRWTSKRKVELINSRVQSTKLLLEYLVKNPDNKPIYIGASAIGIYGNQDQIKCKENAISNENGFLPEVTRLWEESHFELHDAVSRLSIARIGLVLSPEGGILNKLLIPFSFRMGSYFGKGNQQMSWIHIEDMVNIFYFLMKSGKDGIYNAVSPAPVSGKQLVRKIAQLKPGPYFLFGIPKFILKLVFGEMSQAILMSTLVSSEKIEKVGFNFAFPDIESAIKDLVINP